MIHRMAEPFPKPWTLDDFLAWEEQQPERYEFVDGVVWPKEPANLARNAIVLNVALALRILRCPNVFSRARVLSLESGEVVYPDVAVAGGEVKLFDDRIAEPRLIVDVLPRRAADHERGVKLATYMKLKSLRYCLLVSQQVRQVELYSRSEAEWRASRIVEGAVRLPELDLQLPLDAIYDGVPL